MSARRINQGHIDEIFACTESRIAEGELDRVGARALVKLDAQTLRCRAIGDLAEGVVDLDST